LHSKDLSLRSLVVFCSVSSLALALFASPGGTWSDEVEEPSRTLAASVRAVRQEFDLATQKIHASGNVRLDYEGVRLQSDELDIDVENESIEARRNVEVVLGDIRRPAKALPAASDTKVVARLKRATPVLRGERFAYNFGERAGVLDEAKLTFDRVIFKGTKLELKGERLTIINSQVTTCSDERHPHYSLSARSIVIRPGVNAQMRNAVLSLGGKKVISYPRLVVSLRKEEVHSRSLAPRVRVNSTDGVVVQSSFTYPLFADTSLPSLGLNAGLSAKHSFRGNVSLDGYTQHVDYGLRVAAKDVAAQDLSSRILIDKRPEAYLDWHDVQIHPRLRADLFLSTGTVREEEDVEVTSHRSNITLQLTPSFGDEEKPSPFFGSVFARKSWYDDGLSYRVLGASLGVRGKVSDRVEGSLSYITHRIRGATPFEYDDIDIPHELHLTADINVSRKWKVPLEIRYDLSRSSFRSTKYGLLRRIDCLEYGATYDTARREVGIDVRLVGFTTARQ